MSISKKSFGKIADGKEATLYTITNSKGESVSVSDFGATVTNIKVLDKNNNPTDVTLGYDDAAGFEADPYYFGACVGRNANRIADGRFTINGKEYQIEKNEKNLVNLHSGPDIYSHRFWDVKEDGNKLICSLSTPDMDQGYPGAFDVSVTYEFTDESIFRITYDAKSDADTIANMTNHSYFNLNGEGVETILNHELTLNCPHITPVDDKLIPTGELMPVENTAFDFTTKKLIGKDIDDAHPQVVLTGGYDHNFCIEGKGLRRALLMHSPMSGITLEMKTDLPGIQIYAGNYLGTRECPAGKGGHNYGKNAGVALETQYYPDSINQPGFETPILKTGETYHTVTEYIFTVE